MRSEYLSIVFLHFEVSSPNHYGYQLELVSQHFLNVWQMHLQTVLLFLIILV